MEIPTIIAPTNAAATKVFSTSRDNRPGCLSVVGELKDGEVIGIKRPLVADPDPDTPAHWKQIHLDGMAITLTSTHDAEAVPVGMIVLIDKPITANAVGIGWS